MYVFGSPVSRFAFALVGAVLLVGNDAISEYLRLMAWSSAGFAWSAYDRINLAAMMTRRSSAVMSAADGSVFVVYQGARAPASAGWWPAVAYQQTAAAWQASMNGSVRSTAAAVRLRACPVPDSCFESSIATSPRVRARVRAA